VDIDHLVRAHGVCWVDAGLVLGPLRAARTAVEYVAVGVGTVDVDDSLIELASADAIASCWFQVRLLH